MDVLRVEQKFQNLMLIYNSRKEKIMRIIPVYIFIPDHLLSNKIHPCWKQEQKAKATFQDTLSEDSLGFLPIFGQNCLGVELYHEFIFSDDWSEFDIYLAIELTIQSHFGYDENKGVLRYCKEPPYFLGFEERLHDYWKVAFDVVIIDGGGSCVIDFDMFKPCLEHDQVLYVMDYNKYMDTMEEVDSRLSEAEE
jgi:hypothetical protein